ncbi:MAG: hypothetical protein JJU02_03905 [Cryomorphaceae bacterium]|nr:hypothetical protein [Cryomorphaceae bacterium]
MKEEKRLRLRIDRKIVGYQRTVGTRMIFFSKNEFWWNGQPIHHKQLDEFTGFQDKNRVNIYEWDIVRFSLSNETGKEEGVVLWHAKDKCFGIKRLHDTGFVPLEVEGVKIFKNTDLEVFSYLFINPDFMKQLGLEDV